jgi:HAD superfamily phosphatase (TIGR01681 family)
MSCHRIVVFDLDQTLIATHMSKKSGYGIYDHIDDYEYDGVYETDNYMVKIRVRPHACELLHTLHLMGIKLAIYSYGKLVHIQKSVEILFPRIPWVFLWSRDQCNGCTKDLRLILQQYPEFRIGDIVYVDDNARHCEDNEKLGFKCIHVKQYIIGLKDTLFQNKTLFDRLVQ